MTWEELADCIMVMSDEQKDSDVTFCHLGEFYRVDDLTTSDTDDVLDKGHPYLTGVSAEIEHPVQS